MKIRNAGQVGAQTPPTPACLRTCSWDQSLTTAPAFPQPFLVPGQGQINEGRINELIGWNWWSWNVQGWAARRRLLLRAGTAGEL